MTRRVRPIVGVWSMTPSDANEEDRADHQIGQPDDGLQYGGTIGVAEQ
jgi:hypothetical protein